MRSKKLVSALLCSAVLLGSNPFDVSAEKSAVNTVEVTDLSTPVQKQFQVVSYSIIKQE